MTVMVSVQSRVRRRKRSSALADGLATRKLTVFARVITPRRSLGWPAVASTEVVIFANPSGGTH